MTGRPVDLSSMPAPLSRFDLANECLVVALLAFLPLALGAVHAWSQLVVLILAGAAGLCLMAKLFLQPDARFVWSWAYLPLAAFGILAAIQLIGLPATWVAAMTPQTAAIKSRLLADALGSQSILQRLTLSFYPLATRQMLGVLMSAGVVFVVVANVYRRPEQIRRLLLAIALIGAAVAALALAQDFSGTSAIYWLITLKKRATAGSFVNYNNFSQFMNLSIGAAMGLLLVWARELEVTRRWSMPQLIRHFGEPELRGIRVLAAVVLVGCVSIFLSGSRGGMVSLLAAFSVAVLLTALQRGAGGWAWLLVLVGLGAFIVLLYCGFDLAYARLATLHDLEKASGDRWQVNKDVWAMWPRFALTGIGLGAHAVVYPMFSHVSFDGLVGHVENDYMEILEEMGLPGLAIVAVFAVILIAIFVRAFRSHRPIRSAGVGLAFGFVAIAVHSLTDFGQRLPANACLSATFAGLLISLARLPRHDEHEPEPVPVSLSSRRVGVALAALAFIAAWAWGLTDTTKAAIAEADWRDGQAMANVLAQRGWQGSNEEYTELLTNAASAAEVEPDNIDYRHWLNVYRWYSISRALDEQTGRPLMTPRTLEFTARIVDELHAARAVCPTFGSTYCMAGQLELFVLGRPIGEEHIRTGCELAPSHPTTCFVAARLDALRERWDESMDGFRRSMTLGHSAQEVADVYVHDVDRPDLAMSLFNDNSGMLLYVATALEKDPRYMEMAAAARARTIELLKAEAAQPDPPAAVLANMAGLLAREKDFPAAAEHYRRALALDYGNVDWRLARARALAQSGQVPEAMHEAQVCLRLRPELAEAKRLIGELSVRGGTISRQ